MALVTQALSLCAADVYDDDEQYLNNYSYFYEVYDTFGMLIQRIDNSYLRTTHDGVGVMIIREEYPQYWPGVRERTEYYFWEDINNEPAVAKLNKICNGPLSAYYITSTQAIDIHVVNPGQVRLWKAWTEIPACWSYGSPYTTFSVELLQQTGWVQKTYQRFNAQIDGFWVNPNPN